MAMVVKTVLGSHFGVGEFTTHFRTYFSGDWDVHWGYGMWTHGHMNRIYFSFNIYCKQQEALFYFVD